MAEITQTRDHSQYLTFAMAGEEYALGILTVKELMEYETVTSVPRTPPWVRGVINVRGSVVPIIDLAVKFGLPSSPVTKRTCIVIVEARLDGEKTVMGLIADSVSQVLVLTDDDIEPPPAFGTDVDVEFLKGMGKLDDGFALILDIDLVLSANEMLTVAAAPAAAQEADETAEEYASA